MPYTSLIFFGEKLKLKILLVFGLLRITVLMPFLQLPVPWAGQPAQAASCEQQFLSHWDPGIRGLWELGLHRGTKRDY